MEYQENALNWLGDWEVINSPVEIKSKVIKHISRGQISQANPIS